MSQLTLNFDPAMQDRFPTLREFIAHRATQVKKSQKMQAADMDMAPSLLSRKLNPGEGDTQRLNCDDFEAWLASTGDAPAVIAYLASKYMDDDEARRSRVLAHVENMVPELMTLLNSLRSEAAKPALRSAA